MGKILIIAEKPSVAKEIASAVGSTKRVLQGKDARFGYYEGNKYIISWCFGHLVRTCYPEEYSDTYKTWNVSDLPILPSKWKYSTDGPGLKQFNVLKKLLNSSEVDYVICATDADREGELIFRLVYQESHSNKPFKRLWISSMEETAIKAGMQKLRPGFDYDTLFYAASARQKADWIIGMNATRYYTGRFANNSSGKNNILSIGRVQTPTVNLIVKRQKEIDNFKPEPYYVLTADTKLFKATRKEHDQAAALKKAAKCNGQEGYISSIIQEKKSNKPPELYDLTHLQQDADIKFGYSASQTLKIVQSLYEKKLLTYPRTDSQYISSDMEESTTKIVSGLLSVVFDSPIIKTAFANKPPTIKRIINDKKVSGHHAIIPTLTSVQNKPTGLNAQEYNIYQLVALRLLAAVCVPHEYLSTKAILTVSDVEFTANGKHVLQGGWKDIIDCIKGTVVKENKNNDNNDEPENLMQPLPALKEGDRFPLVAVTCTEKFTSPPSLYTEASLLKEMQNIGKKIENVELKHVMTTVDENGNKKMLGTAATQGAIIDKIIKTGYVTKKGRKLSPTEKAFALMKIVPDEIKSPEMTAEWEKKLEEIKDGTLKENAFIKAIEAFIGDVISSANKNFTDRAFPAEALNTNNTVLGVCPLCGNNIFKNKFGNFSCSGWKSGCKYVLFSTVAGKKLTENQVKSLLTKGRTGLIKGFKSKTGKPFNAYLSISPDGKINFEFKKEGS